MFNLCKSSNVALGTQAIANTFIVNCDGNQPKKFHTFYRGMRTPHLRFGFCFILNVCLQLWGSWHELLLFSYGLALMQLWDISQSRGKSMQRKLSGSHIVLQCYHNFDCCSLFSITAASVEVSYAVTVQPKNSYCCPSPQNHCECVTTAIMSYPVARFKQIKSLRDTTVCWFYVNSSNIMI